MTTNGEAHWHAVISSAPAGSGKPFWLYDSRTGFDLTHPESPSAPPVTPRVTIQTTTSPITVDPAKTALVIIDMQNFFLSSAMGRTRGAGHDALDQLVQYAVPAARKAGIRIIWLNWGLTAEEIENMPPSVSRAFGFKAVMGKDTVPVDKNGNMQYQGGDKLVEHGKDGRKYMGLGSPMGTLSDPESGKEIDAGNLLMRDQWNSALVSPLDKMYEEGKNVELRPDVWIHKNRMSGMWGATTECEEFLESQGIKTLLFTGVNTDQCVGGTYQDSFSKGYDCILLNDGCGTTSPQFAQQSMEFNAGNTWGFVTTCKALADGAEQMQK